MSEETVDKTESIAGKKKLNLSLDLADKEITQDNVQDRLEKVWKK